MAKVVVFKRVHPQCAGIDIGSAQLFVSTTGSDVVVYEIDVDCSYERVEYRNVRRLAGVLAVEIEDKARNNSKYEWIFLHAVPDSAVVGWQGWKG